MNENNFSEFGKKLLKNAAVSETGTIDLLFTLGSIHIQIDESAGWDIDSDDGPDEIEQVLQQLINLRYIIPYKNKQNSYKITNSGRNYAKSL